MIMTFHYHKTELILYTKIYKISSVLSFYISTIYQPSLLNVVMVDKFRLIKIILIEKNIMFLFPQLGRQIAMGIIRF